MTTLRWRGDVSTRELNSLHAEAFGTRLYDDQEWDWSALLAEHSLGWVVARREAALVGFVNVLWDGLVHAWLQDTMVSESARHQGIGVALVAEAARRASIAGCEWLHVDFESGLTDFYIQACGFEPVPAGLLRLRGDKPST